MTYRHKGKQFVAIAMTDRRLRKSHIVALALPSTKKP